MNAAQRRSSLIIVPPSVLTAILNPLVSELGMANYFATRVQVALQYWTPGGKVANLAGSMREDQAAELEARASLAKWNPVRHHVNYVARGRAFSGSTLRVCTRIFPRDLYQFGYVRNEDVPPSDVAFVLTLSAPEDSPIGRRFTTRSSPVWENTSRAL